ncbi:MAG TPA: response regulator [Vicinamibacterales bacterium]|jgi:CheY-like chemotaxis protein|nr:response regulator [Vicinamibacterales bacterium]
MTTGQVAHERRLAPRPQLILVADDVDDVRTLWSAYLRMWGFEIAEARNGYEAVELAGISAPAAILMDFSMPGLDGAHAARLIRKHPRLQRVPVVGVTAHTSAALDEFRMSCDAVLYKPVSPETLLDTLRALMRQSATS